MERVMFDLVVIGGGPGGYVAAIRAAQLGIKVACVEKRATLGGTCLNVGCIPSKALLDSSEFYYLAGHKFSRHGIGIGDLTLDLAAMMARKDKVVRELTGGVAFLLKKNKIELITGTASLGRVGEVLVVDSAGVECVLPTRNILLATGSEPVQIPALAFDGTHVLSSTEALCLEKVPEHLIVVGGGYIGLELGSVWRRLGSRVTIVEFLPKILTICDCEIAALLHKSLENLGIEFKLGTKVTGRRIEGDKVVLDAENLGGKLEVVGDKVLVCVGRRAFTKGLNLEAHAIFPDTRTGQIAVDENYQTGAVGIFALGDLTTGPMLAHKAEDEGVAFAERLAGRKTHVDLEAIPSVVYTWPEIASVGPTEEQLKARGIEFKTGKFILRNNGRAKCMDEDEGLVKVLADPKTDRVLGVHIFGPRASDMIAEAVAIIEFRGSSEDIARICHAHPTLSEGLREAAMAVHSRAIHG
ncbi:MAG: dihydrolipoyl dehydrogenase [Planctomycetota bacterium]|nr:dihydrolipoyl dehydrogenase [Planctomycetota bacterium]